MTAQKWMRATRMEENQSPSNFHSLGVGDFKKSIFINNLGDYNVGRIITQRRKWIKIKVSSKVDSNPVGFQLQH